MADSRIASPGIQGKPVAKTVGDSAGLSPRTVELVRKSWSAVLPISDAAATLFYERLFELDPSVKPLFKNDMREQKKKLMQTITVAVDGLASVDKLIPVLKQLGARHAGYMVEDRHYDTVGDALLWTLKEGLGDAFNPEIKRAWQEVYGVLARVMKQGAAEAGLGAKPEQARAQAAATPVTPTPVVRSGMRGAPVVVGKSMLDLPPDSAHPAGRTLVGVSASAATPVPPAPTDGPFNPRTIELVQKSWSQVLPISDAAASLFYERLFELDPGVKPLFKNDMREQKKKLMQTLTVAVDGLSNVPRLLPTLQALGARHAGYMVQERHYDTVGAALLWTLKEGLGSSFTPEVEAAWTQVYTTVADVMKKAAAHQESPLGKTVALHEDDDTHVKRPPKRGQTAPVVEEVELPAPALETMRPTAPTPIAPVAPPAPVILAAPAEPRSIIVQLDGQSLPPIQVRVALDAPSPYLNRGREGEATEEAPKEGLVPGVLLGTICLISSMVASGMAVLASGKTVSTMVLLGLPLATLALAIAAFSFGALWGRSRGGSGQRKP
jgi:hemoglobin-like flavoprotein